MKTILMVAFHYPPFRGSSGIQRTLRFSEHLPEHGWRPVVLSAHPRAYPQVGDDRRDGTDEGVIVARAFALDAARHLAIRGRYSKWTALPDRWFAWWLGAVPAGLRLVREYRPDVLWSTFPIATAHLIGLTLHRMTGIPWIADFRDTMTEEAYPYDRTARAVSRRIERLVVRRCARAVFTAPGTLRMYAERYPELPADRWLVVENGYDEESFAAADRQAPPPRRDGRICLLHSGLLYPLERDPSAFFAALAELRERGAISARTVRIVLRASGNESEYRRQVADLGLSETVEFAPPTGYVSSLAEMLSADGLLVFQGAICNHQIPAKIYECLRAGRPILALTDPEGDTAAVLRGRGGHTIVRMDSKEEIARGLVEFLSRIESGEATTTRPGEIESASRRSRTIELVRVLDAVT